MDPSYPTTTTSTNPPDSLTLLGDNKAAFQGLETFPTPSPYVWVELTSDEVTAVCPVTGQPDYYTVTISYIATHKCLESKSLKLYFVSLRSFGLFCEALADKICADVADVLEADWVQVQVKQKSRGGISITAKAKMGVEFQIARPNG